MNRKLEALLVRRFRREYRRLSGIVSQAEGYAGLIEEVSTGLQRLNADQRREIDHRFLPRILFGPCGPLAAAILRRVPRFAAWFFRCSTPLALRYLVGPARSGPDRAIRIPRCRFREAGGEIVCREVCQKPTEEFFRSRLNVKAALVPLAGSCACEMRFESARQETQASG